MNRATAGYIDTGTESMCNALEKELTLFVEVEAKNHGAEGKPQLIPEWKALFLNKVETTIQGAIDKNAQLLPISGVVVAQKGESEAIQAIRPLQASQQEEELRLASLEEQKDCFSVNIKKRGVRRLVYIAAGIIAIAEGFFAYDGIRRMPLGVIPAFISSVAITVALAFGTHIFAGFIKKATTKASWLGRFFLCTAPVFLGFLALGYLRARAYATDTQMNLSVAQETVNQPEVSALALTILSLFLFLASLLFSTKYYKSKVEKEAEAKYDKASKEIKKSKLKINEIQDKIDAIRQNARTETAQALARYEYALSVENRLKNMAKRMIADYIIKNIRYRKDGAIPEFFSNPPELSFKLFFDNFKNNQS